MAFTTVNQMENNIGKPQDLISNLDLFTCEDRSVDQILDYTARLASNLALANSEHSARNKYYECLL